jgi:uncharacterized protein YukE
MARIRVDTEDLKNKAKDFASAADAFNKAGDDILSAAMSMPSYDGQLSGPARKAGYEIQSQSRDLKANLSSDAQSLQNTAQSFEAVDSQTVNQLGSCQSELSDQNNKIPAFDVGVVPHGDSQFGYSWDPTTGKLTIWHNGQALVYDTTSIDITTPEGKLLNDNLEAFKAEVIAYETAIGTRDDAIWVAIGAGAVFGLGFIPEPLSVPLIAGGGITALISIGVALHAASEAATDTSNCNTLWDALEKGNQYNESYSTNPPTATPSATPTPTYTTTPTSNFTPAETGTPTPYNPTPTPTQPQTSTATTTPIPTTTPTPTP